MPPARGRGPRARLASPRFRPPFFAQPAARLPTPASAAGGRYPRVDSDIAAAGVVDMAKAKLLALLTRDHRALAEQQSAAGRKDKAAQLFRRAGDFEQAARLAAEIGDERLAVEAALRATLRRGPQGHAAASAQQAAQLLAVQGPPREAGRPLAPAPA